jgi:DNA invertase Pin-like site-specific DNA recombinase
MHPVSILRIQTLTSWNIQTIDSRQALNDLMMDARRKKFDAGIVWKLNRLGRSIKHLITDNT